MLETYAATVEGVVNLDNVALFGYVGLAMQEGLECIQGSLEILQKKGALLPPSVKSD